MNSFRKAMRSWDKSTRVRSWGFEFKHVNEVLADFHKLCKGGVAIRLLSSNYERWNCQLRQISEFPLKLHCASIRHGTAYSPNEKTRYVYRCHEKVTGKQIKRGICGCCRAGWFRTVGKGRICQTFPTFFLYSQLDFYFFIFLIGSCCLISHRTLCGFFMTFFYHIYITFPPKTWDFGGNTFHIDWNAVDFFFLPFQWNIGWYLPTLEVSETNFT